ncbi:MAG: PEP-CTERM sorting domain-containing protein [Pirellulales bacterium]|nr:PEP-CTERM sorting domain-containing protein [Pirellulales bacterium]
MADRVASRPAQQPSAPVPEPATVVLLIMAASGLRARQNRARRENSNNSSTRDTGHQWTVVTHVFRRTKSCARKRGRRAFETDGGRYGH